MQTMLKSSDVVKLIKQLIAIKNAPGETITQEQIEQIHISDIPKSVLMALELFKEQFHPYLSIEDLLEDQTNLIEFAGIFSPFLNFTQTKRATGYEYTLADYKIWEARTYWLEWQKTKEPDNQILKKYQHGQLNGKEWLTQSDIEILLAELNLRDETYVIPFTKEDIGLCLHLAKVKHQNDRPKTPYTIPFLINLGEDKHSSQDSQGSHWARMIISIDPSSAIPKISVNYTDSLPLKDDIKPSIEKLIKQGLSFKETIGNIQSDDYRVFQAFPESKADDITFNIQGSTTPQEALYNGYLSLQGLMQDLGKTPETLTPPELKNKFDETLLGLPPETTEAIFYALANPKLLHALGIPKQIGASNSQNISDFYKKIQSFQADQSLNTILSSTASPIDINVNQIQEPDKELKLTYLCYELSKKTTALSIKFTNPDSLERAKLEASINLLPTHFEITADSKELEEFLNILKTRNQLIQERGIIISPDQDTWSALFDDVLFTPPHLLDLNWPIHEGLGSVGFSEFLKYLQENQFRFLNHPIPYSRLSIQNPIDLDILTQNRDSLSMFKELSITINELSDTSIESLTELASTPSLKKLEVNVDKVSNIALDTLKAFISEYKLQVVISFKPQTTNPEIIAAIKQLENLGLANQKLNPTATPISPIEPILEIPEVVGPIANAMLGTGPQILETSTEQQQEQQQQQQQQQQTQSSSSLEEMSEEDELVAERFTTFSTNEKVITKETIGELSTFIQAKHPHLTPEQCWNLITGENSDFFKYGITQMTLSAAKVLIDNLVDVQYGLHPDNLPQGFALQQANNGRLTLTYNRFNPPINPKESPLTIKFSQAKVSNAWDGDARQFLNDEKITALHTLLRKSWKKIPTLDACRDNFFNLKAPNEPPTIVQKLQILEAFSEIPKLSDKLKTLFEDTLSASNISALSEILYEQGPAALDGIVERLTQLKKKLGQDFFKSFKQCFIDPSQNLTELTDENSLTAFSKLETFTPEQKTWWLKLTADHMENSAYLSPDDDFTHLGNINRHANLADLVYGFTYFNDELQEITGLKLTTTCPLAPMADMRVGLDRLLTILRNSHDMREQFIDGLQNLSLDGLGAFYASRYEGFKLVTSDMNFNPSKEKYGFNYKIDKDSYSRYLTRNTSSEEIALRYVATFNYRGSLGKFRGAFEELSRDTLDTQSYESIYTILANFGIGKHGKDFTLDDIKNLKKLISPNVNDQLRPDRELILNSWGSLRRQPIRPSIGEIFQITSKILEFDIPFKNSVTAMISQLIAAYKNDAQSFIDGLVLLSNNKTFKHNALLQCMFFLQTQNLKLPPKMQSLATKVIAICNFAQYAPNNIETFNENVPHLYDAIQSFSEKQGETLTLNLIELLSHIDLENSASLPTLEEITGIINELAEKQLTYATLEDLCKTKLPGCIFDLTEVVPAQTSDVDVSQVIAQCMPDIIHELKELSKSMIIRGEAIDQLCTDLVKPDGPKILLDNLEQLNQLPDFVVNKIENKVKDILRKIYKSTGENAIAKLNHPEFQRINAKLNHRIINQEIGFSDFTQEFSNEFTALNQLFFNLQKIKDKWPKEFSAIIQKIDQQYIFEYRLGLLAQVSQVFLQGFEQEYSFPSDLWETLLSKKPDDAIKILPSLEDVLNREPESQFNNAEKKLLATIALKKDVRLNMRPIFAFKDSAYFQDILVILSQQETINLEMLERFESLTHFSADEQKQIYTFFAKYPQNFPVFINGLNDLSAEKRAMLISIALKATQKDETSSKLDALVETLKSKPEKTLIQLANLYKNPNYPGAQTLLDEFNKSESLDIKALKERFDLNPHGKDGRDFDTSKLIGYIDNLEDMNHGRPFLKTQRKELQQWFLFINAIGNKLPIFTASGEAKVIKDMSSSEIKELINNIKTELKNTSNTEEQNTLLKLQLLALMREVMYRSTGKFPRPTQMLYLLLAMQKGNNFIGQIQTGQGKSMITALSAVFNQIQGKTVDICTKDIILAEANLRENQAFFDYLDIPTQVIHATSELKAYQANAIHYSCVSDLSLYKDRTQLLGKTFPDNACFFGDEIDSLLLDQQSAQRIAVVKDKCIDPDESPYKWIYQSLIDFAEGQPSTPKDENQYLDEAKNWLLQRAATKIEKQQLQELNSNPEELNKRLTTWLIAAGKTKFMVDQEESKFRVVTIEHPRKGKISKACILTDGRPNIAAEFSECIQQFLHLRLQTKYQEQINKGDMPDFLISPEKDYITSKNMRAFFAASDYKTMFGLTGTAGTPDERLELEAIYGFKIASIPPFKPSNRQSLKPILTHSKFLTKPEQEEKQHIDQVVKEILRYLDNQKVGRAGPILVHCQDKTQGEKFAAALEKEIGKNPQKYASKYQTIQRFYSSDKPTAEARIEEERNIINNAGNDGTITFATAMNRGTDIKPTHANGLYSLNTYIYAENEDPSRNLEQKYGRAGRAGARGLVRSIVKRSELCPPFNSKQCSKLTEHPEKFNDAILDLSQKAYPTRQAARERLESFNYVENLIYAKLLKFFQAINDSQASNKADIKQAITKPWTTFLENLKKTQQELQHIPELATNPQEQLKQFIDYACTEWNKLSAPEGAITKELQKWATLHHIDITLPVDIELKAADIQKETQTRHEPEIRFYVPGRELISLAELSEEKVYVDLMSTMRIPAAAVVEARERQTQSEIQKIQTYLNSSAHQQKLKRKFTCPLTENVSELTQALLYLRYHAWRDGNTLGYTELTQKFKDFCEQMKWSANPQYINAVINAQYDQFTKLSAHIGQHEPEKTVYINTLMREAKKLTSDPVPFNFDTYWRQSKDAQIKQFTDYRDKWWKRSWVSEDRKVIVNELVNQLNNNNNTPAPILESISNARTKIFENDKQYKRSLGSSIDGRLFQYLNQLEQKVHAAMSAKELTDNADNFIKSIEETLKHAGLTLDLPNLEGKTLSEKYHVYITFLNNQILRQCPDQYSESDWRALQDYCRQTVQQMYHYFSQSTVDIHTDSIAIYLGASRAVLSHLAKIEQHDAPPTMQKIEEITFKNKKVKIEKSENLQSNSFLKTIHQEENYKKLLESIEKHIGESSQKSTQVTFSKIEIAPSNKFQENGIALNIQMIVNNRQVTTSYQINMDSGELLTEKPIISPESTSAYRDRLFSITSTQKPEEPKQEESAPPPNPKKTT